MLETFLSIASTDMSTYEFISNIRSGGEKKLLISEISKLRLSIEKLSDHIYYAPTLHHIKDTSAQEQHTFTDLAKVREYLEPAQRAIGSDIISSAVPLTLWRANARRGSTRAKKKPCTGMLGVVYTQAVSTKLHRSCQVVELLAAGPRPPSPRRVSVSTAFQLPLADETGRIRRPGPWEPRYSRHRRPSDQTRSGHSRLGLNLAKGDFLAK